MINLYCVVWTEESRKEYRVPKNEKIIVLDMNKPDALAIFDSKEKALIYRNGNLDFKIVKIKIPFKDLL